MKKDLLSILDLSPDELREILDDADQLKMLRNEGRPHEFLYGKALALVFEKASTRTRISFEVGMEELGGHALFLNPQDLQIGRGEEIRDTARVMSRYVSGMMIRAYKHSTIEEFARNSSVPVINGLSDIEHPCQILADIMTMREHFGSIEGLRVSWIGDGNNVCNSLVLASARAGFEITVASPERYRVSESVVKRAESEGGTVTLLQDPIGGCKGCPCRGHGHLDIDGGGERAGCTDTGFQGIHGQYRYDEEGGPWCDIPALPSRSQGAGGHRRGDRRPAERGL